MKEFFRLRRKLHLWLLAALVSLFAFFAVRDNRAWMNSLTEYVTNPFRRWLGRLAYRAPFSVMEALVVLLVLLGLAYLIWNIASICRAEAGRRGGRAYSALLGAACAGLTFYSGLCWLWGVQYYADGFQEKSGVYAQAVALEDLEAVTQYFAHRLAETADQVARDEAGRFAVPQADIFAGSTTVYSGISTQFPFLEFEDVIPKPVFFSRVMSMMDCTGVYCPFTGESNLNVDSPTCFLPATIAHELAHQRGIASEQECNFIAVLASTTSGQTAYAYSGWLLGYVHLGNALYSADRDRWQTVYKGLPETVRADLSDNNAYWAQFESTPVQKVSNTVYDNLLKGYGDEYGMKSYGKVVDLLVAYYADLA